MNGPILDPERASVVRYRAALLDAKKIVANMSRQQLQSFMAVREVKSKDDLIRLLQQERYIILSSSILDSTLEEALALHDQLTRICKKPLTHSLPRTSHVTELLPFLYFMICQICMYSIPYEIQFATGKLVLLH